MGQDLTSSTTAAGPSVELMPPSPRGTSHVFEGALSRPLAKGRKWDQEPLWKGGLRRPLVTESDGAGFKSHLLHGDLGEHASPL